MTKKDYYKLAFELNGRKKYIEAIKNLNEIIKIEGLNEATKFKQKDANVYYMLGYAKNGLEKYDGAIKDFDKAIKIDAQHAGAYKGRGFAKNILKKYHEAKKDCERAIALDSEYVKAYAGLGYAKNGLEKYDEAIKDFDKALDLVKKKPKLIKSDPKYKAVILSNRGYSSNKQKKYDEAIKDFNQAIKLDKFYSRAYYYRGLAHRDVGEEEKANNDFQEAFKLTPHLILEKVGEKITKRVEEKVEGKVDKLIKGGSFQETLKKLHKSFSLASRCWLVVSVGITIITTTVFVIPFLQWIPWIPFKIPKSIGIGSYFLFSFLSIVTFSCFRLYATTRRHAIETQNRVAVSEIFAWIEKDDTKNQIYYQSYFLPRIAEVIITSLHPEQNKKDSSSSASNVLQDFAIHAIMNKSNRPI